MGKALNEKFISGKYYGYNVSTGCFYKTKKTFLKALEKVFIEKNPYGFTAKNLDKGRHMTVKIGFDKFSSVCPYRNSPDVSKIRVEYTIKAVLLELVSFRCYMDAFALFAVTHESVKVIIQERLEKELGTKVKVSVDASPFLSMDVIIE